MPMPRFTIRCMMIAVVVAAVLSCVLVRRAKFKELAAHHSNLAKGPIPWITAAHITIHHDDGRIEVFSAETHDWHIRLQRKYERASCYPWLPVEPDPPAPVEATYGRVVDGDLLLVLPPLPD